MTYDELSPWDREILDEIISGSRFLLKGSPVDAIQITNLTASQYWLSHTKWCVKDATWFFGYVGAGPLILFRQRLLGKFYLMAPAQQEFRNARNRRMNALTFVETYPKTKAVLESFGVDISTLGDWHKQSSEIHRNLPPSRPDIPRL